MPNNPRWAFIPQSMLATGNDGRDTNDRMFNSILRTMALVAEAPIRPIMSPKLDLAERQAYAERIHQIPIEQAAYQFLMCLHAIHDPKLVHLMYTQDNRKEKEQELGLLLTEHRRDKHLSSERRRTHYQIRLMGEPGYRYPLHAQIGTMYAGDELTLVNNCVLIKRRESGNEKHTGERKLGYYLVPTSF